MSISRKEFDEVFENVSQRVVQDTIPMRVQVMRAVHILSTTNKFHIDNRNAMYFLIAACNLCRWDIIEGNMNRFREIIVKYSCQLLSNGYPLFSTYSYQYPKQNQQYDRNWKIWSDSFDRYVAEAAIPVMQRLTFIENMMKYFGVYLAPLGKAGESLGCMMEFIKCESQEEKDLSSKIWKSIKNMEGLSGKLTMCHISRHIFFAGIPKDDLRQYLIKHWSEFVRIFSPIEDDYYSFLIVLEKMIDFEKNVITKKSIEGCGKNKWLVLFCKFIKGNIEKTIEDFVKTTGNIPTGKLDEWICKKYFGKVENVTKIPEAFRVNETDSSRTVDVKTKFLEKYVNYVDKLKAPVEEEEQEVCSESEEELADNWEDMITGSDED